MGRVGGRQGGKTRPTGNKFELKLWSSERGRRARGEVSHAIGGGGALGSNLD